MADEQSIFLRALELPSGTQRQEFLAEACGGDTPLRSRIDALLARHADDAGFLEPPGPGQQATVAFDKADRTKNSAAGEVDVARKGERPSPADNLRPGTTVRYIGDYEIISEVARGGMGVVYKARQVRLKRIVALKMILSGEFASEADIRRFHTEAEAAAQLDHPHIVPVYEVGQHQGIHYFSMGFVDGSPMSARIAEAPYAARDAAIIVRALAEAVDYAHGRGVIHRDLKPSNVMIDKSGQPRVTDFGLAKQTKGNSSLTGTGFILGTPSYMPPEQATGRTDLIGERADIYALGAILYAALTGRPPFQADSPLETLRQVMQQEPVAPRQLNPSIPRDLETICLRCLEKQMHRRYETALQLADELGRFLEGKPILARPVRSHERLWKWCRRNRIVAGLLATVAMSLIIGTIVSTYFAIEARRRANENLELANKNLLLAAQEGRARAAADDSRRAAEENEKVAKRQTRVAQLESANLNLNEAHIHCEKGDPQAGLLWMAAAHERATQAGDADLADACRSMASLWLPQVPRLKEVYGTTRRTGAAFGAGDKTIIQVDWAWEFSADQRESDRSVSMALERGMTILDTATGEVLENIPQVRSPDKAPVLSPDRTRILLLDQEHQPRIWSIPDRTWVGNPLTPAGPIHQARFSGDGWRLVTMSREGQVEFWNASDGQSIGTAIQHEQHASPNFGALALMPQGQVLVTSGRSGELRFWDPNNGAEVWERLAGRSGHVPDMAVQPQGGLLATYRNNVTPKIVTHWLNGQHTVGGEAVTDLRVHALKYSPDGRWIAEGGDGNKLVIRDGVTAQPVCSPALTAAGIWSLDFSQTSREVLLANYFMSTEVWELPGKLTRQYNVSAVPDDAPSFYYPHETEAQRCILTVGANGYQRLRRPTSPDDGQDLPRLPGDTLFTTLVPSGESLVGATEEGRIFRVSVATGAVTMSDARHSTKIRRYFVSPTGTTFGTTCEKELRLWRAEDATPLGEPVPLDPGEPSVNFSSDGELVSVHVHAGRHMKCHVLTTRDGTPAQDPIDFASANLVALHPDGRHMVVVVWKSLDLWTRDPPKKVRLLGQHDHNIRQVGFSQDGKLVFTLGEDRIARVWNVATGERVGRPMRGVDSRAQVVVRPDGKWIGILERGKILQHWHVASGRLLGAPVMGLSGNSLIWGGFGEFGYSADSREFVFYDPDTTYRFIDTPRDPEAFRLFLETWTGLQLEGNDLRVLPRAEWSRRRDRLARLTPELIAIGGESLHSTDDKLRAGKAVGRVEVDARLDDWGQATELVAYRDRRRADQYSARIKAQWDDQALYLCVDWRDPTPLVNNVDADTRPREGWKADCLQGRFRIDGREYHLTAWYSSKSDKNIGVIEHGTPLRPNQTLMYVGAGMQLHDPSGFQQAFARSDDARGYIQELRIPWKLLDDTFPRRAGADFRFTAEFFWGDQKADDWPGELWSTPINPRNPQRHDLYKTPAAWGTLELVD